MKSLKCKQGNMLSVISRFSQSIYVLRVHARERANTRMQSQYDPITLLPEIHQLEFYLMLEAGRD